MRVSATQSPAGGVCRIRFSIAPLSAPLMSAGNVVIASLPSSSFTRLEL